MKVIQGNRNSGSTTALLLEADKFNIPILVSYEIQKKAIQEKARELNLSSKLEIISYKDIENDYFRGRKIKGIIIDDIDFLLKRFLSEKGFYGEIISASLNYDSKGKK